MAEPSKPAPRRTAAVIAIGDELVIGQKLDTNCKRIAAALLDIGITTTRHATIDDDQAAIAEEMLFGAKSHDMVISTGGLGPTADDLTRHALAEALEDELETDAPTLDAIRERYKRSGRTMPEANAVQAMRPASAELIPNPHGTAPGLKARIAGVPLFCLPGPPSEMVPMLEAQVLPALTDPQDRVSTHFLQTFGLGESTVAEKLGELMDRDRNPLVGTTASGGTVTIRIRATGETPVDDTIREVRERLGPVVFAEGETTLAEHLVSILAQRGQRVATAESCTGGAISHALTSVAGSSDVFEAGYITYSNGQKTAQLGVEEGLLSAYGAVSPEVVHAMAEGALARSNADHALAVSGIAGPGGGSETKPVGTVWIALASRGTSTEARRFAFPGDRAAVRARAASAALAMLRLRLDEATVHLLWQQDPSA